MWKNLLNLIPGWGPVVNVFVTAGNFIAKHWQLFLFLGMFGIILYQNTSAVRFLFGANTIPYLKHVIQQKDGQIKNLQNVVVKEQDANKHLTNAIGALNSTIGQWVATSNSLAQQNALLNKQLKNERIQVNKKIQSILNAPAPKTCKKSMSLLRTEIPKLIW